MSTAADTLRTPISTSVERHWPQRHAFLHAEMFFIGNIRGRLLSSYTSSEIVSG